MSSVLMLLLTLLIAATALGDQTVTLEDLRYGQDAFHLHMSNTVNTFVCEGVTYQMEDKWVDYADLLGVYGGKTRAVYEMTVPSGKVSLTENDGIVLGTLTITPSVRATLVIAEGNRLSGEFVLCDPIPLTDPYIEQVTVPRDSSGAPLLIDRVYMYSFEEGGETQHYAASLFIDYEGFSARHGQAVAPVAAPTDAPTAAPTEAPAEPAKGTVSTALLIAGVVLYAVGVALVLRKRAAKKRLEAPVQPQQAPSDRGSLSELAKAIKDPEARATLEKFNGLCDQIIAAVADKPEKAPQTRKFFSYYLPTVARLANHLVTTEQRSTQPAEMDKALKTVRYGFGMAVTAAQKQLDNLYQREQLDADADIAVMENMLKVDGFAGAGPQLTPKDQ